MASAGGGGGPKQNIISELVGKVVCIVTLEGRCLVGMLRGIDSVNNLVLENSHERTFHADRGMEMEPMGLYLVRGDSLCVHWLSLPSFPPTLPRPCFLLCRVCFAPLAPLTLLFPPLSCAHSGIIGEIDEELDASVDWDAVRGGAPEGITINASVAPG
jgi:small nuclear ribonucleoprotein (snRNP)-like protein